MHLACYYLLFFLLHLSAASSTCDATSRNHRVFLHPGRSDVASVPAPAIGHDRRHIIIAKDLFHDARYPYRIIAAEPPPGPPLPLRRPPEKDRQISGGGATMTAPSPSSPPAQVVDDGGYHREQSLSSEATATTAAHEGSSAFVVDDYEGPQTHPPSHH